MSLIFRNISNVCRASYSENPLIEWDKLWLNTIPRVMPSLYGVMSTNARVSESSDPQPISIDATIFYTKLD